MKDESELESVTNDEAHAIFERDMRKGVTLSTVLGSCIAVVGYATYRLIASGEAPAALIGIPLTMAAGL